MTATLTTFLSPHLNTLPIYSTLSRNARARFALPCLVSSGLLLAMALPFALVPYYLLPELPAATPTTRAGVFARLPDDGWVDLARVLQCVVGLGSANAWVIRGRDCIAGGAEGMRWVGLGLWVVVVGLACLGGVIADKVETLGVIATLALGWFLPGEWALGCADGSDLLYHHVPCEVAVVDHLSEIPADTSPQCG